MDRGTYEVPLFGIKPIVFYRDKCQFILKSPKLLDWAEKVKCEDVFADRNVITPHFNKGGQRGIFYVKCKSKAVFK